LDEHEHEVIDLAVLDSDGNTLLHTAIFPESLETADQEMLDAVGFDPGDWAPSPHFAKHALRLLGYLTRATIVGHNTQLHMRFINRLLRKAFTAAELEPEEIDGMMGRIDTQFVDTLSLAWEHLELMDLDEVCIYLRIPYTANHSALEDARASQAVYEMLRRATAWNRWWWRWRAPRHD
jgi:DNA polymerase III epsilon subunit-like protein